MDSIKVKLVGGMAPGHKYRGVGNYSENIVRYLEKCGVRFVNRDPDIYFCPFFNFVNVNLAFPKPGRLVVMVHDCIRLIYPQHYPMGIRGGINFLIQKYLLGQADTVITNSETSKKDIVRFLGLPEDKVVPIYLAPGEEYRKVTDQGRLGKIKEKYQLPDRFVLYVGDVNYNKNIGNLIEACQIVELPLVIVGKQAKEIENMDLTHPELRHMVPIAGKMGEGVIRTGYVPTEDLVGIYNLASVYAQPSVYEGFGIPVVNAFAAGSPVAISKTQALVEVAAGAAVIFDPHDGRDIARVLGSVVNDKKLSLALRQKGFRRARDFSWDKTARQTADVFRSLVLK